MKDFEYIVINGVSYHPDTDMGMARILDVCRRERRYVRIEYDANAPKGLPTEGYVERSVGEPSFPLLTQKSLSTAPRLFSEWVESIAFRMDGNPPRKEWPKEQRDPVQ